MKNMRNIIIIGVIVLAFIGFLSLLIFGPKLETEETNNNIDPLPSFELKDFEGTIYTLEDFEGKNFVINSWASWCPFCTDELPDFTKIKEEMGDQITIVAINRNESDEVAKEYKENLDMNGELIFLQDPGDTFYQSIGGFSMPETLFINEDGFIIEHYRGPLNYEEIKEKIENLIKE